MSEKEALSVIESMIFTAKKEIKDNGFYFMLWGWLVFIGALADFLLLTVVQRWSPEIATYHALPWGILMPLGALITFIMSKREKREAKKVRTYVDELMKYALTAYVVSLVIVCFIMPFTQNWRAFFPVLMLLYAMWLYISGGMLRFKPLMYGGIANWIFALVAFNVGYDWQLLLLAAAVFVGYIIPGHMLKARFSTDV